MKAKNENSLICAYTRAREENCGEVLPKQDLFSSIVLVFREIPVDFCENFIGGGFGMLKSGFTCPSKNFLYYRVEVGDFSILKFCD